MDTVWWPPLEQIVQYVVARHPGSWSRAPRHYFRSSEMGEHYLRLIDYFFLHIRMLLLSASLSSARSQEENRADLVLLRRTRAK
jgi:hypothetical protein